MQYAENFDYERILLAFVTEWLIDNAQRKLPSVQSYILSSGFPRDCRTQGGFPIIPG